MDSHLESLQEPIDGDAEIAVGGLAERPSSLVGVRLGLLSNGKPNAAQLLESFGWQLSDRFQIRDIASYGKADFGVSIDDDLVAQIRAECDVVVVGVGD